MGYLIRLKEMTWLEACALLKSVPYGDDLMIDGYKVRTNSQRYTLFRKKGRTCVTCKRVGIKMCLERHRGSEVKRAHFNLYDKDNHLMTKDHIIPKSRGGRNIQSNYQPMCQQCNSRKGSKI